MARMSYSLENWMPSPHLDNLVRIGQLKAEPAVQAEIDGLMRSGAARIKDAENEQLSIESRFDLAYNAAHAFSLAALRFHGYRSGCFSRSSIRCSSRPLSGACSTRLTRSGTWSSMKAAPTSTSAC
jgi:hypothetical protein